MLMELFFLVLSGCGLVVGLEVVVVENLLEGEELRTDVDRIEAELARLGPDKVVCVLTTSSCFAPRTPDR